MKKSEKKKVFIEKAEEKFSQFDYSKVEEFSNQERDKIIIICPIHGEFYTTPKTFLNSKHGCPKCARNHVAKILTKSEYDLCNPNLDFENIKDPIIAEAGFIIGSIYCFKNRINNKIYIGETIQPNYRMRFGQHKLNSENGLVNHFYNAIRKYSWDSFDKFILFQTEILRDTPENKIKLTNIINLKEKEYIRKFNSDNDQFGYNMTEGGDGVAGYTFSEEIKKKMSKSRSGEKHWNYGNRNGKASNPVLQFDLDFNLIQEWPSMAEIGRQLNYDSNNISRCCSNLIKTYKGYIWVKKEDYFNGYLEKYKSNCKHSDSEKPVLQFDFFGNKLNEYFSAKEASVNIKEGGHSMISKAASGKNPQAFGYIWIYKELYSEELLKEKLENIKTTKKYKSFIKNYK